MKVLKEHLLPAVRFLGDIAGNKTFLPFQNHFRLAASGGTLSVRATDLDQDATVLVECNGDLSACCVNARHISSLVADAGDTINIVLTKDKLCIDSGFKASLPTLKAEEFPAPLFKDGVAQGIPVIELADAIDAVVWAKSVDQNRYALQGVHVACSEKKITCEATDGKVMAVYDKAAIASKCDFILHANFASRFAAVLREPGAEFKLADNSVCIRHPKGEYAAKLVEANFPSTSRIRGVELTSLGNLPLNEAREHVRQCIALSRDEWPKVLLDFSSKGCEVSILEARNEEYSCVVGGKYTPLKFETDANRLLKGLRSFNGSEKAKAAINADGTAVFSDGDYTMFITGLEKKAP